VDQDAASKHVWRESVPIKLSKVKMLKSAKMKSLSRRLKFLRPRKSIKCLSSLLQRVKTNTKKLNGKARVLKLGEKPTTNQLFWMESLQLPLVILFSFNLTTLAFLFMLLQSGIFMMDQMEPRPMYNGLVGVLTLSLVRLQILQNFSF